MVALKNSARGLRNLEQMRREIQQFALDFVLGVSNPSTSKESVATIPFGDDGTISIGFERSERRPRYVLLEEVGVYYNIRLNEELPKEWVPLVHEKLEDIFRVLYEGMPKFAKEADFYAKLDLVELSAG
jgi:hypothetical protein